MPVGSYRIERYKRFFALYEGEELLAVTVYRRGANALKQKLEAQDKAIVELQQRFNRMAYAITDSLPLDGLQDHEQTDSPTVHEEVTSFCRQL